MSWADVATRVSVNSKAGTEVMEVGEKAADLDTPRRKHTRTIAEHPLGGKAPYTGGERTDETGPAGNSAQRGRHL